MSNENDTCAILDLEGAKYVRLPGFGSNSNINMLIMKKIDIIKGKDNTVREILKKHKFYYKIISDEPRHYTNEDKFKGPVDFNIDSQNNLILENNTKINFYDNHLNIFVLHLIKQHELTNYPDSYFLKKIHKDELKVNNKYFYVIEDVLGKVYGPVELKYDGNKKPFFFENHNGLCKKLYLDKIDFNITLLLKLVEKDDVENTQVREKIKKSNMMGTVYTLVNSIMRQTSKPTPTKVYIGYTPGTGGKRKTQKRKHTNTKKKKYHKKRKQNKTQNIKKTN